MPDGKNVRKAALPDADHWEAMVDVSRPLVDVLELDAVQTVRAEAELIDSEVTENLALDRTVATASGQANHEPGHLRFRINHEAVFTDEDGRDGARIAVDFEVGFNIPEDFTPTAEQVEAMSQTVIPKIVHPFYREAVSSLLARVGVGNVTVGLVKFPPSPRREKATKARAGRFEVYQTRSKKPGYRWRLRSANGAIVAAGESYETKAGAKRGIQAVQSAASAAEVADLTGS